MESGPASGSFPMSQFFVLGSQNIGVSASTSVLPMNIQDWFPWGLTGLDLLAVQGTLKSLLQHQSSKHQFFSAQLSLWSSSHIQHPSVPSSMWVQPPREQDVVTLHSSHAAKWPRGSPEEDNAWRKAPNTWLKLQISQDCLTVKGVANCLKAAM